MKFCIRALFVIFSFSIITSITNNLVNAAVVDIEINGLENLPAEMSSNTTHYIDLDISNKGLDIIYPYNIDPTNTILIEYEWWLDEVFLFKSEGYTTISDSLAIGSNTVESFDIATPNQVGIFDLKLKFYRSIVEQPIQIHSSQISITKDFEPITTQSQEKYLLSSPCENINDIELVNEKRAHHNSDGASVDFFSNEALGSIDPNGYLKCKGDNAYASSDGVVRHRKKVLSFWGYCREQSLSHLADSYGNYIDYGLVLETNINGDSLNVYYLHIDPNAPTSIRDGSNVKNGDYIGEISKKGCALGEHIHYSIFRGRDNLKYSEWELTEFASNSIDLTTPTNNQKLSSLENIDFNWNGHSDATYYWLILNGKHADAIGIGNKTNFSLSPNDWRLRDGNNTWQIISNAFTEQNEQIVSKTQNFSLGVADTKLLSPISGSVFIPKTVEESIKFEFETHKDHLYEFKAIADGEVIYQTSRFPISGSLPYSSARFITLPKSWFSGYSNVTWQVRSRASVGGELAYGAWKSASFSLSYPQSAPTPTEKSNGAKPVFRFYNSAVNSHIYTMSTHERDTILDGSPGNSWYYEGISFYAYSLNSSGECNSGQRKIFRFRNKENGRYLYSINGSEVPTSTWFHEGAHYCGWANKVAGSIPAYRMYSATQGRHFITLSSVEKDSLLRNGWYLDGILFYAEGAIDEANGNAVSVYRFYNSQMKTDRLVANQALADQLSSQGTAGWQYKGVLFVTSAFTGSCSSGTPVYEYYHRPSNTYHYKMSRSEVESNSSWKNSWDYKGSSFCAESDFSDGLMPVYESKYAVSSGTTAYQTRYLTQRSEAIALGSPWELSSIPFYVDGYKVSPSEVASSDVHLEYRMNINKITGGATNTHVVTAINTSSGALDSVIVELPRNGLLSYSEIHSNIDCNQSSSVITCDLGNLEPFERKSFNIATVVGNYNGNKVITPKLVVGGVESFVSNNSDSEKLEVRSIVPVTRYYNGGSSSHLFTVYNSERSSLDRSPSWHKEGTAFRAYQLTSGNTCPSGTLKTYRIRNTSKPFYIFTTNSAYYSNLSRSSSWNGEGIGFCTPKSSTPGARPIYRLYNARNGNHLFTGSTRERDALRNAGWYYEGVHFYAF